MIVTLVGRWGGQVTRLSHWPSCAKGFGGSWQPCPDTDCRTPDQAVVLTTVPVRHVRLAKAIPAGRGPLPGSPPPSTWDAPGWPAPRLPWICAVHHDEAMRRVGFRWLVVGVLSFVLVGISIWVWRHGSSAGLGLLWAVIPSGLAVLSPFVAWALRTHTPSVPARRDLLRDALGQLAVASATRWQTEEATRGTLD